MSLSRVRRLRQRLLAGAEAAAAVLGVGCLLVVAFAHVDRVRAESRGRAAFDAVRQASSTQPSVTPQALLDEWFDEEANPGTDDWNPKRIAAHEASRDQPEKAPLALLEIDALDLDVLVLPGTDTWALNRGVGHVAPTSRPGQEGNCAVAGHRDGYFRCLRELEGGELIRLTTKDDVQTYRVTEMLIVNPEDVEVLSPTVDPTLTLITCHPFYFVGSAPQRYIVRAELIDAPGID